LLLNQAQPQSTPSLNQVIHAALFSRPEAAGLSVKSLSPSSQAALIAAIVKLVSPLNGQGVGGGSLTGNLVNQASTLAGGLVLGGLQGQAVGAYRAESSASASRDLLRALRLARLARYLPEGDFSPIDLSALEARVFAPSPYSPGDQADGQSPSEQGPGDQKSPGDHGPGNQSPGGQSQSSRQEQPRLGASLGQTRAQTPKDELSAISAGIQHFLSRPSASLTSWLSQKSGEPSLNPAWVLAPFSFSWEGTAVSGYFRSLLDRNQRQCLSFGADFLVGSGYYAFTLRSERALVERWGGWPELSGLNHLEKSLKALGFTLECAPLAGGPLSYAETDVTA
jgi:hypothetical protein